LIVVGSGPAGVSAAEAFRKHNSADRIRILTADPALPYARPPLSKEFLRGDAEITDTQLHPAGWFEDNGIELVSAAVDAIDTTERAVIVDGGSTASCAHSHRCPAGDRRGAGLATHNDRVVVDARMRTSAEDIYAAGDVAYAHNDTAGRRIAIEHWQDAVDQGEIAGNNAAGEDTEWAGVPGFWTTIGEATVKYHAWGDGYDRAHLVELGDGFTVWYESGGTVVGVLTHNGDDDYDRGEALIATRSPVPEDVHR
jgi:NADPH-dependent 2,4-dienoyl-CoA reductase/sulfur reductase-like enzyme